MDSNLAAVKRAVGAITVAHADGERPSCHRLLLSVTLTLQVILFRRPNAEVGAISLEAERSESESILRNRFSKTLRAYLLSLPSN